MSLKKKHLKRRDMIGLKNNQKQNFFLTIAITVFHSALSVHAFMKDGRFAPFFIVPLELPFKLKQNVSLTDKKCPKFSVRFTFRTRER